MTAHSLYQLLVPTGVIIGHVGIAAKMLPRVKILDPCSRWLAHLWAVALLVCYLLRLRDSSFLMLGGYDSALIVAVAVMAVAVLWEHAGGRKVPLSPLAALTAAAFMSHGRGFDSAPVAADLDLPSVLLVVHVVLAWVAFAVLAVNSFAAIRLVLGRGEKPPQLERWLLRSLWLGVTLELAALAAGAICLLFLPDRAAAMAPAIAVASVPVALYGVALMLRLKAGWAGRRLALVCLVAFVLLAVSARWISVSHPEMIGASQIPPEQSSAASSSAD